MTYFTTKVPTYKELAAELNRLETDGHTIFQVIAIDGAVVIISHKA